ncbi:hypothetical protein Esti_003451 [Eimeria stiedai]
MPAATAHRAASAGGGRRRGSSSSRTSGSLRGAAGGCYRGVGSDATGPLGPRADAERRGAPAGPPSSQRHGSRVRVRGLRAAATAAPSNPEKTAATSAAADTPRRSRASARQQASRSRVGPAAATAGGGLGEPTEAAVGSPVGPARRSGRRNQAAQAADDTAAAAATPAEPESGEARALPRRERKLRGAEALRYKFSRFSTSDEDLREQLCGCCLDGLLPGEEAEEPVGVASSDDLGGEATKAKAKEANRGGGPPGGPPKKELPPPPPPLARIDACDHYFHLRCIQVWAQRETTCPLCKAVFSYIGAYSGATRELLDLASPTRCMQLPYNACMHARMQHACWFQKCTHVFQKDLPSSSESVETVSSDCSSSEETTEEEDDEEQQQQQQQGRSHRGRRGEGSEEHSRDDVSPGVAGLVRRVLESWGRSVSSSFGRSSRSASHAAAAAAAGGSSGAATSHRRRGSTRSDREAGKPEEPRRRQWRREGAPGRGPTLGGPSVNQGRNESAGGASPVSGPSRSHARRRRDEQDDEPASKRPTADPTEVARRTAEFFERRVDALYAPDDSVQQQQREGSAAAAAQRSRRDDVSSSGDNHSSGLKSSSAAAGVAARRRILTPVIVPLAAVHGIGGSRDRGAPQRRRRGPPSSGPSFNLRPSYAEDFLVCTGDGMGSRRGNAAPAGRAL